MKVKDELDCGPNDDNSAIHSIVWEDLEPMEGQDHSQLITADKSRLQIWDLNGMVAEQTIAVSALYDGGDDLSECTVVKRDPHD